MLEGSLYLLHGLLVKFAHDWRRNQSDDQPCLVHSSALPAKARQHRTRQHCKEMPDLVISTCMSSLRLRVSSDRRSTSWSRPCSQTPGGAGRHGSSRWPTCRNFRRRRRRRRRKRKRRRRKMTRQGTLRTTAAARCRPSSRSQMRTLTSTGAFACPFHCPSTAFHCLCMPLPLPFHCLSLPLHAPSAALPLPFINL